ncbi:MAG: GNAT family N-acetyltransferase [Pseudobdellovibrionaceae bacterium]|nr:GNAT family N-acetyltransferase [Pseudobdellovibrionaceae bacterium]
MPRSSIKTKPIIPQPEHQSLCQQVWGLDWSREFPIDLGDGVRIEYKTFHEAQPLMKTLLPEVYQLVPGTSRFGEADPHHFKEKYFSALGDFFAFYEGETNIGMAIGTLLDWSSYNFRNIAVAPAYQNQGLYPQFFEVLSRILKAHGVARIEGDVAPTNRHHIHALNKMGYIVTSMTYGERWGVLLHITKYLDEADEERLGQLYSTTYKTDAAANKKFKGKG